MQETVSGIRVTGDWDDVAETGEEVTDALKDAAVDEEQVADWEQWRPRRSEAVEEVREKTVEQAVVKENAVESNSGSVRDTANDAAEAMSDAVREASAGRPQDAAARGARAARSALYVLDTVARKLFRRFEQAVYRHIIVRTNPFYFDGEMVSARFQRRNGLNPVAEQEEFELSVDINDDEVKERVSERMVE